MAKVESDRQVSGRLQQTTTEAGTGFTKNRAKLKLTVKRLPEPMVTYTVCTATGSEVADTVWTALVAAAVVVGWVVEMVGVGFAGAIFGVQYAKYKLVAISVSCVFFEHLELTQVLKNETATDC